MGLSVIISGGVIAVVLFSVLFAMPTVLDKLVSVSDTSTQSTELDTEIVQTDVDLDALFVIPGLSTVNFTLINDESEKLWNFEDFDIFVTYDGVSGDSKTEILSYEGDCPTIYAHPTVGNWCIQAITGVQDPGILNGGERAILVTKVSENLANVNVAVSLNTDNGVIATLVPTEQSHIDVHPTPPVACLIGFYGWIFLDTDTGIAYACDPTRDKWLSLETMSIIGETDPAQDCDNGDNFDSDTGCHLSFGNSLDGLVTNPDIGVYIPHDFTITAYGLSMDDDECLGGSFQIEMWETGSNLVDEPYTFATNIIDGLTGPAHNGNNLSVDVDGDQYTMWGIDNNCTGGGSDIDDVIIIIYFKWHHADP